MKFGQSQDQDQLKWNANPIWDIFDDRLRDMYVPGKYRDVTLPLGSIPTPARGSRRTSRSCC